MPRQKGPDVPAGQGEPESRVLRWGPVVLMLLTVAGLPFVPAAAVYLRPERPDERVLAVFLLLPLGAVALALLAGRRWQAVLDGESPVPEGRPAPSDLDEAGDRRPGP